jgi:hypothetical protein
VTADRVAKAAAAIVAGAAATVTVDRAAKAAATAVRVVKAAKAAATAVPRPSSPRRS